MIGVIPEGFRELEEEEDPQIPAGFSPVETYQVKEVTGYRPGGSAVDIEDAIDPQAPYMSNVRKSPPRRIIMHGDVNEDADALIEYGRKIDPERGFAPGYHFYIGRDGKIKQGAPVDRVTNHTLGENSDSIGINIAGADEGKMPTPAQEAAASALISKLGTEYGIDPRNVIGHGELQPHRRHGLEGGTVAKSIREKGYTKLGAQEGGKVDYSGNKINTMEDYQAGTADYVTVAMDKKSKLQGKYLRSPAFPDVRFKVADTGSYGEGKGEGWMDIAWSDPQKAVSGSMKDIEFYEDILAGGPKFADTGSDAAKRAVIEGREPPIPEGFVPLEEDQPPVPEGFTELSDDQPAFPSKQSPPELIEHVGTAIEAGKSVWESAKRGVMSSGLGIGETINRYAYSPIVHGLREAIDYIAPGSDLARHAATFDDAFYENTVAKPAAQRAQLGKESAETGVVGEVAHAAGQLSGDLLPILLTSGVLPGLKGGMELVNALRHGAASMTLPAMRAGADEAENVKKQGGSEIEQLGAFIKATTISMGMGAVPMATSSSAPTMAGRFAERAVKSVPLGSATVEAGRMTENAISSVTGGEQRPFSLEENIKGTIPAALLGGVMGRNTSAKSRVIRDIQATAESAGVKVTPEQVEAFVGRGVYRTTEKTPRHPDDTLTGTSSVEVGGKTQKTYTWISSEKPATVTEKQANAMEIGAVANPKAVQGVEMAKTEAKRSADFVRGLPKWNDYIKNILTWSADNAKDKHNTRKLQESMMKDIPENVRNAIPNWIEAGGDAMELAKRAAATKNATLRKGYEDAARFGPEEVAVAQNIKQRYDDYVALAKAEGIDIQRIQNYVTHMWKNPDLAGTGYTRGLSSYFKYAKQRSYPDFFTGEQAGEVPKTKDIAKLLPIYENALNDAINAKRLAKSLQQGKASDGRPLVDKIEIMSSDKGLGYKTIENNPAFNGLVVHPEIHLKLSRAVGQSKLREWLDSPSDNPFTEYGKGAFRALEDAQGHMKATTFSLSPFHQVHLGKHSIAHLINPLKHLFTEGVNPNDPGTYYAMKHGLMVAPDTVSQHHFLEGVGAGQKNLVTKALRKMGMDKGADVIDGYTSYLFERFIPALKLDTFGKVMARNQKRYAKELKSGKVTLDQVASRTADEVNASYGHLNYVKMGRSPTVQHWLQIALLAPDFFEARIRYAAQGAQGLMGSKSTEQMMSLAGMAVALYVLARVSNTMDHGDAEWDPEHAFKFVRGNKSWGIRSVPGDLHDLIFKGVGRFIANRVSPLAGRGTLNLLSGENWRGEKTDFGKTITEMISNTVPMPLQGYTQKFTEQERAQSITPMEKFMQSWGFQVSRHSPITVTHNLAREWMKTNDPKRYKKLENSDFPESEYRALRYALEDSDEDGAREQAKKLGPNIGKGFQQSVLNPFTGSNASDQKFYDSLSDHDKELFKAAIKRRALILERYREWVGPLGTKTDVTEAGLYRRMREAKMKKVVLQDEQP